MPLPELASSTCRVSSYSTTRSSVTVTEAHCRPLVENERLGPVTPSTRRLRETTVCGALGWRTTQTVLEPADSFTEDTVSSSTSGPRDTQRERETHRERERHTERERERERERDCGKYVTISLGVPRKCI